MKVRSSLRVFIGWALVATALLFGAAPLWATPILDQEYDAVADGSNGGLNIQSDQQVAQTFTVGIGGRLVRVDVQARTSTADPPSGDLLFDIRPTVGGVPVEDDTLALANVAIPATDVPPFVPFTGDFVSVDLSAFSISVTPGDVLAIVLRHFDTGSYVWLAQSEGLGVLYDDGAGFARRFSPTWGRLQPDTDFGFRTFVPEPTTLALMAVGLAGVAVSRRRKLTQA